MTDVKAIALVDSSGEIFQLYQPTATVDPEGAIKIGETDATRIHITEDIENEMEWIETHYWKDGAWKTRPKRDRMYNTWKDEAWVLDSDALMAEIRRQRDAFLYQSDWTQLGDCKLSLTKQGEWTTYRQALRDVPANNSSVTGVASVSWPTKPS